MAKRNLKLGFWVGFVGVLVALSPLFLSYLFWAESGFSPEAAAAPGGGPFVAMWFLMYTVPLGALIMGAGLVVALTKKKSKSPFQAEKPKEPPLLLAIKALAIAVGLLITQGALYLLGYIDFSAGWMGSSLSFPILIILGYAGIKLIEVGFAFLKARNQ